MHLSVATHICGGEIAAVKLSLSGKKATCGMENPMQTCPAHKGIQNNCCQNQVTFFSVDNNYNPSTFQAKEVVKNILQTYAVPVNTAYYTSIISNGSVSLGILPDIVFPNKVTLSEIRVFRI